MFVFGRFKFALFKCKWTFIDKSTKKKLLPFKASLEKVILVKNLNDKKNILRKKRGLVQAMLIVLFGVVSKYRIDD